MSLAIQQRNGNGAGLPARHSAVQVLTPEQIWDMAERVARCGMYSIKNAEQAFVLMSLCQSKGLNAIEAVERYDIIQNRPAMKAVAISAEFMANGGRVKVLERSAKRAAAVFSHPELQPDGVELSVTFEQFQKAGLTGKDNWKNYPDDMLWWRLVAKGVRTVYPGVILGIHSEHEAADIAELESPVRFVQLERQKAAEAVRASEIHVYGHDGQTYDDRPYAKLAVDTMQALNAELTTIDGETQPIGKLHAHIRNKAVQTGYIEGTPPTKSGELVRCLDGTYKARRDWLRKEVNAFVEDTLEAARQAAKPVEAPSGREEVNAMFPPVASREPGEDDGDPDGDYPPGT